MTRLGDILNSLAESAVEVDSAIAGIKANKVLWSGSYGMDASQSITLSESAAAQTNGIVLIWSAYSNGAAANSGYSFFFIPKEYLAMHSSAGINCTSFHWAAGNDIMAKYVYVSETKVTGNARNWVTTNGASNPGFVLRYVIGV